MPETINKFAAEKDKRTSVQGLRSLIQQNQKRQSAIPSWVKPAPQVIQEEEPSTHQAEEPVEQEDLKEEEKLSHVSSESDSEEEDEVPEMKIEVSSEEVKEETKEETKEEKKEEKKEAEVKRVDVKADARRTSVIREVVKPRAMNVVSTDMDDYLKSDQKDNPDKWMEITNIEGDTVYLNKRTGQTTFLKPTGVQGAVGEHDDELWFWVPS